MVEIPRMPASKSILSSAYGRSTAIMIHRRDGTEHLFPAQEILWASSTLSGGSGVVELETRSRVVRLAFSRPEATAEFMDQLYRGTIHHIHEGTAPLLEASSSSEGERGKEDKPVTLAVEILDRRDNDDATGQPDSPRHHWNRRQSNGRA